MKYLLPLLLLCPVLASASPKPKLPRKYLRVPLVRQETSYSCGPAALLAVMRYWEVYEGDEKELYPLLGTSPEEGTHPKSLKNVASAHGLSARFEHDMTLKSLLQALKKGETAIVDIQAWKKPDSTATWEQTWEDGHYVVLVGKDSHFLYVMDPSMPGSYGYIPKEEFESRWHDYENEGSQRVEYMRSAVLISGDTRPRTSPRVERVE
ncbi:MAG: C39 family peptidase [Elusimicrobiota bacterium]